LGAIAMVVLVFVTSAAAALSAAVISRHRAQAAADLAALGAAHGVAAGPGPACARAQAISAAMRSQLTRCQLDGLDVIVTVEVPVRVGNWTLAPAQAVARAGPVY